MKYHKTDAKTTTYRIDGTPFLFDVTEAIDKDGDALYEAYIHHENYGTKFHLFGGFKRDYKSRRDFVANAYVFIEAYDCYRSFYREIEALERGYELGYGLEEE